MATDELNLNKFPNYPDDQQLFLDNDGNSWIYDNQTDSWEFQGPKLDLTLATLEDSGLLSSQHKLLLDTIAQFPGAFGIIVDKPYKQTIQGDVKLVSNSLDINCLSPRGTVLDGDTNCATEIVVACADPTLNLDFNDNTSSAFLPRFEIKLNQDYLDTLCIDLPAPKGKRGKQGAQGKKGDSGFGDGPRGIIGEPGPDLLDLLDLNEIIFDDLDEISDVAIVDLELVDRGKGPFLKCIRSTRTLAHNECAQRLLVTPVVRTITFAENVIDIACDLTGLTGWTINKVGTDTLPDDLILLRGSDDETEDCSSFSGTTLSQYTQGLIDFYEQKIVKLDKEWALAAKLHIEGIDAKARTILSELANDLARCESALPGTEFGITFKSCTPCSPSGPEVLSVAEDNVIDGVMVSGQEWDIIS